MSRIAPLAAGALGLALALCALPSGAAAMSCCAGASTTPGRLMLHEEALVGVDLRLDAQLGAYDPARRFHAITGRELGFEQGLFGALRIAERGQLALRLPLRQQARAAGGLSEWGGGIGDVGLAARWEFIGTGERLRLPGLALLADALLPTGRAPEAIELPLGSDATGAGAYQLYGGLQVEQLFDGWMAQLSARLGGRLAREARGIAIPGSWLYTLAAAVAFPLPGEAVIGGSLSFLAEPSGGREALRLGLSGGMPLTDEWRIQAQLFGDPPWGGWGRNQVALLGGSFTLIRAWS